VPIAAVHATKRDPPRRGLLLGPIRWLLVVEVCSVRDVPLAAHLLRAQDPEDRTSQAADAPRASPARPAEDRAFIAARRRDVDQSTVENISREVARDFAVCAKHRTFVHKTSARTELFIYTEEGGWVTDSNGGDILERVLRTFVDGTLRQIKAKCEMLIERGEKQQADSLSDLAAFLEGCQFRKDWRKTLVECAVSSLTEG
jgi:hypothetical protein